MSEPAGGQFDFNNFSVASDAGSVSNAHGSVPVAASSLPAPPAGFTGRHETLDRLLAVLAPDAAGRTPVLICSVSGLGGIGKTALALRAGHEALKRGWFPGGALFVDLRGYDDPVGPDQAVVALLSALGVPGPQLPPTPSAQFALYRTLLAQRTDPVLLILDNASRPGQILPLLPGTDRHRVIVTSRHRLAELEARLLDLGPLPPDDAVDLLVRALRIRDPDDPRLAREPEALATLADLCGGLPLALALAAAQLGRSPGRTVASLVEELHDAGNAVVAEQSRHVFASSYRRLPPGPARTLRMLALAPTHETGADAVAVLAAQSVAETTALLEELAVHALVVRVSGPRPEDSRWRLHNLLRDYLLGLIPAGDEEAHRARCRLLAFYQDRVEAPLHWPADRPEAGHGGFADREEALSWLREERPNLIAAAEWARDERYAEPGAVLALTLLPYLASEGHTEDALVLGRIALDATRRSGERGGEAHACLGLGFALSHAGRTEEAVEALDRARDLFRSLGDAEGEAVSSDRLGAVLHDTGRTSEAVDAFTRALLGYRQAGDTVREAAVWNNLGIALRDTGRADEAVSAFARAMNSFEEIGHAAGQGDVLNNLGITLQSTGRFDEAVAAFRRAADLHRNTGNAYGEGNSLHNLALSLAAADRDAARGYWSGAAEAYDRAGASAEAAEARRQAEGAH
ncbi:tetratricopeptide repeat protein [Streptomyces sp. NPDC088812]|uniref:tetratricopeptide repeat protein n=1 Tax=Streptomyces sp. NPDC088812 TaxID=3365905 RepID=UPI00382066FE